MPNFLAEFTGRSLLAFCCCTLAACWPAHSLVAQANAPADTATEAKTDGATTDGATAKQPPADDKPFEIGTAKDAAEYEVLQKRAIQQIDMNLGFLTGKILKDYKNLEREYRTVMRQGVDRRKPEENAALRAGLDYRTLVLSDPDVQSDPTLFSGYVKGLARDVSGAAPQAMVQNANSRAQQRRMVCEIVFTHLQKLVTSGNFKARSAALEQLLVLEVVPGRNRQRIEMYDKVHELLVQVLNDPNQPDAVKLRAANVMKKYLQKADAIPQIEMAFAEAINAELHRKWLAVPYMNSMLSAMEWVRAPRKVDGDRSPVVYCSMVDVINNKELDLFVRCRAARVMGRAGFDRNINFEPVAWATAALARDTALAYFNATNSQDPKWARCGWFLYTAFHHEDGKEADGQAPMFPKGTLNRAPNSEFVRDAYKSSVPVMAHLMSNGNPKQIGRITGPLLKLLQGEKPANMKCDPACAELGEAP